jgi:hypothetical protein
VKASQTGDTVEEGIMLNRIMKDFVIICLVLFGLRAVMTDMFGNPDYVTTLATVIIAFGAAVAYENIATIVQGIRHKKSAFRH